METYQPRPNPDICTPSTLQGNSYSRYVSDTIRSDVRNSLEGAGNFPYLSRIRYFGPRDVEIHFGDDAFREGARKEMKAAFASILKGIDSEGEKSMAHHLGNAGNLLQYCLQRPEFIKEHPEVVYRITGIAKVCHIAASRQPLSEYLRLVEHSASFEDLDWTNWLDAISL